MLSKKVSYEAPGARKKTTWRRGAGGGRKGTRGLCRSDRTYLAAQLCLHRLNDSGVLLIRAAGSATARGNRDFPLLQNRLLRLFRLRGPGIEQLSRRQAHQSAGLLGRPFQPLVEVGCFERDDAALALLLER
jgi:hypothetical protein